MKRKALLGFLAIIGALTGRASAQDFRVTVLNDLREPLPYAYVYLNRKAAAVTDTLGVGVIPLEKLKEGDTLSASYVATEPQWILVDRELKHKAEHTFALPEAYRSLTAKEAVVKRDVEELFRKQVETYIPYVYQHLLNADMEVILGDGQQNTQAVTGDLEAGYMMGYNTRIPYHITTESDTTAILEQVEAELDYSFHTVWAALNILRKREYEDQRPIYGYLGKEGGRRIFRISYPALIDGMNYQILLKVGETSKLIEEMALHIVYLRDGSVTHVNAGLEKAGSRTWIQWTYKPTWIDYRYKYANGRWAEVRLSDMQIKFYNWNKKKIERYKNDRF